MFNFFFNYANWINGQQGTRDTEKKIVGLQEQKGRDEGSWRKGWHRL